MKPFLKWAGGKRWLVSSHESLVRADGLRYIEPFLGSGAVFFHVEPEKALLSDSNEELIAAFAGVRDEPERVQKALQIHQRKHCDAHYYSVRASRPRTTAARAARLIYLNRTCWNALYRVNLKGEFNVPIGTKTSVIMPDDDFLAWSALLQAATLKAQDFEQAITEAGEGDFVYADPPYTVQHNMNNFVKYNERIFSWSDQLRLARCLHDATARGAHVVVSNADTPDVSALYAASEWAHFTLGRSSILAASSDRRRKTTELVISNCLDSGGRRVDPRVCRASA